MLVARRRIAFGLALFGTAAWLSVSCPAATPAAPAGTRTVTLTLSASGKARWSTKGGSDTGALTLSYNWHGTLRLGVPTRALQDPAHATFSVGGATTLRANWVGELSGKKLGKPDSSPYRCKYAGRDVPGRVTATLTRSRTLGKLQLVLHPRGSGFFPAQGGGATVSCSSAVGAHGPTHFEPQWLFRDALQDHGHLSSDTAVIVFSSALLPRGSVTVTFPREVGSVDQPVRPKLAWNNRGRLTLRAR